jgi:hypothetical protein
LDIVENWSICFILSFFLFLGSWGCPETFNGILLISRKHFLVQSFLHIPENPPKASKTSKN